MVLYIFLVAALNLALGFGVAVYLGRRYRTAIAAEDCWCPEAALGASLDGPPPGAGSAGSAAAAKETHPGQTPPRPSPAAPAADHSSATLPPGNSPAQQSVDDLSKEVLQYHQQVAEADEELRVCAENPQAAEIEAILGSLLGSTQQYLESRNRVHGTFQRLHQGQAETGMICDDLQAAIQRQDQQIQRTSRMIQGFDYQSDLEEGCRQILNQTGKLIDSNGQLREVLDEVKLKLAGSRPQQQNPHPPTQGGTPGEVSGRTGLEAELRKWWIRQPDAAPCLSVAMIELDDSAGLKQQHGGEVVEQILRGVGQLLEAAGGGEGSFLRLPRQRFCFLFPDTDTRPAAHAAERLRQTVQQAHLEHEQAEIRVTVSCAVVGTAPADTPGTLAQRAEATLQEARRYGCNRTFLHDGKYPTPVVPPVFSLEEQHVTL